MRKLISLAIPLFMFLATLLYLHQKVQICVEAYRLNNNYRRYNELVDKRDYLMYNFVKEVSLAKVNQWAQKQHFAPVSRERIVVLGISQQEKAPSNVVASLLNRFLRTSTSTSTALAKDKK